MKNKLITTLLVGFVVISSVLFVTTRVSSQVAPAYDLKMQREDVEVRAFTRDNKPVLVKVSLNYHIEPNEVENLDNEIGSNFIGKVIQPATQESIAVGLTFHTQAQLITQRQGVKNRIQALLTPELRERHILVDDVWLTSLEVQK